MCRFRGIVAVILVIFLAQSTASAAMLDQSYDPGAGSSAYYVNSIGKYAQVFQAGLTGPISSIDVRVSNYFGAATAPLNLELWTVTVSYPETLSSKLASASISQLLIPSASTFVSYDLSSSGASVTSGNNYAIVLSTTSSFSYLWNGTASGGYANGSGRVVSGSSIYYTMAGSDWDFGFKTYVVPEPATLLTGAIGSIALLVVARRRRARA